MQGRGAGARAGSDVSHCHAHHKYEQLSTNRLAIHGLGLFRATLNKTSSYLAQEELGLAHDIQQGSALLIQRLLPSAQEYERPLLRWLLRARNWSL